MDKLLFVECHSCRIKPGTPPLCDSCLRNRNIIERANAEIKKLNSIINLILDIIELRK